ncbi:hypothetical protein HG263_09700 [Pseudoalteromonas sp. JBTF-M23]|uniref:Flagellar hook-length control protein-like C-terminal domain-containing protein n=1 Tax=Pseudoalteromonas caenipelagi TaxID=2726988 RepID=A0A849VCM4_9GAMM|nr:flagellar hook-length control protein FliK [Pseudoalteromonas caenipelagi]NOU50805.1 hypothetical protein [Pseudoalteromonas caenipelagi]
MLNVTFNNTKVSGSDASSFDSMNTQSEGASNESTSFLFALKQLTEQAEADEQNTPSDTDITTQNEQLSKELIVQEQQTVSDDHATATATSEEDAESSAQADTELSDQTNPPSPKSADDLLAQINASNQQKATVTVHDSTNSNEQGSVYTNALQALNKLSGKSTTSVDDAQPVDSSKVQNSSKLNASEILADSTAEKDAKSADKEEVAKAKLTEQPLNEEKPKQVTQTAQQDKADVLKGKINQFADNKEGKVETPQPKSPLTSEWGNLNEEQESSADGTSLQNDKTNKAASELGKKNELAKQISELVKQADSRPSKEHVGVPIIDEQTAEQVLQQKLTSLTPSERSALQKGLQQLVNEGKATPMAERALEQLKALEQKQAYIDKPQSISVDRATASASVVVNKTATYNSTKVDKDTLKNDARSSLKAVGASDVEKGLGAQTKQDAANSVASLAQSMPSPQVEQLFKAIVTPQATANSPQSQVSEFVQYMQQLEEAPQSIQHQQSHASTQKVQVDAQMLQAVNIARNDAAKMLQEKVSMMLNLNNQEAEIRLDPRELGMMQIRIRTDAEQAQVNFVVQNQQAKDLLEQSMPKLREMLAEQGIELGQSNIEYGDGSQGEQGFGSEQQHGSKTGLSAQSEDEQNSDNTTERTLNDGSSIDYYA